MKLCKDCRCCEPDRFFFEVSFWLNKRPTDKAWKFAECHHPEAIDGDPPYHVVNGVVAPPQRFLQCVTMRQHACGASARLFEPREAA